jgi:hemolysin III
MTGTTAEMATADPTPSWSTPLAERPTWRGWMHLVAFMVSVPAMVVLIIIADSPAAVAGSAIYGTSLLLGFGASAAYHRVPCSEATGRRLQRLDHSMIYVLIAGTYTPMCLVALPWTWGIPMLCIVWTGAAIGVTLKWVGFDRFRIVGYSLYPILGWAAVIALPVMFGRMTHIEFALVVLGGVLYTVGFPVLLVRRPDPWPRTFGYHEVWHTFTVLAGVAHFAAVSMIVAA